MKSMRDFDDEDPLALISDNSDDSFYENPKPTKKETVSEALKKSPLDLGERKLPLTKTESVQSTTSETRKPHWSELKPDSIGKRGDTLDSLIKSTEDKQAKKPAQVQKKVSFENDDDILDNIGLDNTKPANKKSSILDDLLGTTPKPQEKTKHVLEELFPKSTLKQNEPSAILPEPKKDIKSTVEQPTTQAQPLRATAQYSPSLNEPRRGRRSGSGMPSDPLGLLTPQKNEELVRPSTASKLVTSTSLPTPAISSRPTTAGGESSLPDWLNVAPSSSTTKLTLSAAPEDQHRNQQIMGQPMEPTANISNTKLNPQTFSATTIVDDNRSSVQLSSTASYDHLDSGISLLDSLKHQEAQLIAGAQMVRHEQNLMEIQRKQKETLERQERQFNEMIQRHNSRQKMLEAAIKQQQEIINSRLQILAFPELEIDSAQKDDTPRSETKEPGEINMKANQMLESAKELHREETTILEQSYKRQITLLEESLSMTENRLKTEIDAMILRHSDQISNMKQEHEMYISELKERLKEHTDRARKEIEEERESHRKIQERMKEEFEQALTNAREARHQEVSLSVDARMSAVKLIEGVQKLDNVEKMITETSKKLDEEQIKAFATRERLLSTKEEEVNTLRAILEQQRENSEKERAQLVSVVKSLELRLLEQTKIAAEDRWALQQATAAISASSTAMERDQQHYRELANREHTHLKTLKEELLAERQRMLLELQDERRALAAERGRLETAARLAPIDQEVKKAELEAALNAANEAKQAADAERRDLEAARRIINEQQKEIQKTVRMAEQKKREGDKALEEAKAIESQHQIRLQDIRHQLANLAARERKLAEDKIAMSRERIQLQQAKRCGLCEAGTQQKADSEKSLIIEDAGFRNSRMDAELLKLTIDLDDSEIATKD